MSSQHAAGQQGRNDANGGKGPASPQSFTSSTDRQAYDAAYQAEQARLRKEN